MWRSRQEQSEAQGREQVAVGRSNGTWNAKKEAPSSNEERKERGEKKREGKSGENNLKTF